MPDSYFGLKELRISLVAKPTLVSHMNLARLLRTCPLQLAMAARASAKAWRDLRAKEYGWDALPYSSSKNGFIASNASGSNLVVAAWSA